MGLTESYSRNKYKIVNIILIIISFILIVLSLLNIRGIDDSNSKEIVSYKQNINTCCYIILSVSLMVLVRSIIFLFLMRKGSFDPLGKFYSISQNIIVYLFPFILLVLSIIIRSNVSYILPDLNNKDDVNNFNKNNWSIDNIQRSSNGLLIMSIILFLWGAGNFAYRKYFNIVDKPPITQQTVYDKQMEFFKNAILKAENEFNIAQTSGAATKDWLRNKANYIQQLKLKMLGLSKQREVEVQKTIIENLKSYEESTKALEEAKERTPDEIMFEAARGSVDIESIVPEHLQSFPIGSDIKIRTAPRTIAVEKTKPSSSFSSSSGQVGQVVTPGN